MYKVILLLLALVLLPACAPEPQLTVPLTNNNGQYIVQSVQEVMFFNANCPYMFKGYVVETDKCMLYATDVEGITKGKIITIETKRITLLAPRQSQVSYNEVAVDMITSWKEVSK